MAPPEHKGFGSVVIKQMIEHQLQGRTNYEWSPEGLKCNFFVPHEHIQGRQGSDNHGNATQPVDSEFVSEEDEPSRVLIVEDDTLLSLEYQERIRNAGYKCVGPAGSLHRVIRVAETEEFDAAVLDVNLDGDYVFPVAYTLKERNIPFVFLTGYEDEVVNERFKDVPVISKPCPSGKLESVLGTLLSRRLPSHASPRL